MKWDEITLRLKETLIKLYTEESSYRVVAREAGIPEESVRFTGRARDDWSDILKEADKHQKILEIIGQAKRDYPENTDLKQIADEYILQNTAPQRDSRSTSKTLPSDITTVYDKYLEILQLKREIAPWATILANTDNTSVNQEDLHPKNMSQVQQSIRRLSNLIKEEYDLLEKDSNLRDFFGQSRYDLMKTLNRVGKRSDDLAAKIPIFMSIFSPQSMVAVKWQQDIRQILNNILSDLQDIDNLVQPLQRQPGPNPKVVVPPSSGSSKFSNQIQGNIGNLIQGDHANITIYNKIDPQNSKVIISPNIDEEKLRERIFSFYRIEELIDLFHNLSQVFSDPGLEYEKLPGNNAKEKIAMLFQSIITQGKYEQLKKYLLAIPEFSEEIL
jgi:Effector-associated domain 1